MAVLELLLSLDRSQVATSVTSVCFMRVVSQAREILLFLSCFFHC